MPCHTIVHRQDWFLEESYRARTDREEPGFLDRSFELHFNERPFLNHFSYLFITRTTKERMRQQSNFSVLCRGHILPREVRDKDGILRFLEAVEQFGRIICDSGLVRLERLTTEEITGKGKEAGLVEKYFSLSQEDTTTLEDIRLGGAEMRVGDKRLSVHTLSDADGLPSAVRTDGRYEKYSTDRSDCRLSFAAPVGLMLPYNHICNQYVFIDDPSETLRHFEKAARNMRSLSRYSRANEINGVSGPDGSIRQSADTYERITEQLETFYETPQETAGGLEQKVDELNRRLEEAEAENRRAESRERMMEQSYRMAARYLNPKPEATPGEAEEEEKPEPVPVSRAESGTTSALEQPLADSAFVASLVVERNYGFNTAVGSSYRMGMNTIPACISESQTLEQGGRVKLRLLEPLQAGSVTIPANSLVTGTADIRGERLDILVSSIEYAGNIIPVELATYDIDGQRGIFVPGSESRTAAKEVLGDVSQSMGGSISFAGSAGQQVAMDLTRGVLQGGTRFISQRVKAVKVKLKAGYRVLLVTKKQ